MPDFVPGLFNFFGIAIGGHKFVASGDNLDNKKDASDDNHELEDVAEESEKTLTFVATSVFVDGRGRRDIAKSTG